MTNEEAVAAVKAGGRCETRHTILGLEIQVGADRCSHHWRTVACDGESDVIECSICGKQLLVQCNFDEDCS